MLVRDGREVGGAIGVKRGAAVILPVELAIDSSLGNPLGEDNFGAAEGTRAKSDSTPWVELVVAGRSLLEIADGAELGLKPILGVRLAFRLMVVLGAILALVLGVILALGTMPALGTADFELKVGITLGAVLALVGVMMSLVNAPITFLA
jgi:hypothetical protein